MRSSYNYDRREAGRESALVCTSEEDMAQQQFKDESDINVMVRRFMRGDEIPHVDVRHGDFTRVTDFHSAMNEVVKARESFERLPARIRSRFDNDPGKLLDFVSDERNEAEGIRLGILPKPEADDGEAQGEGSGDGSAGSGRRADPDEAAEAAGAPGA